MRQWYALLFTFVTLQVVFGTEPPLTVLGMQPVVLTKPEQLDEHHGKLVVIRGHLSGSEMPHIIGVEVAAQPALRGQLAAALGILVKTSGTKAGVERSTLNGQTFAGDPSARYRLYRDLDGNLSKPFLLTVTLGTLSSGRRVGKNMFVDEYGILRDAMGRAIGYWGVSGDAKEAR